MFSAILITGGYGTDHTVEVFLPSTSTSCELPGPVLGRFGHTQDNLLACGGCCSSSAGHSCEEFSPATGTWARTHTLQRERWYYVSWSVEEGTILMGGGYSGTGRTSEIVKHDGTTETSFDMRSLT